MPKKIDRRRRRKPKVEPVGPLIRRKHRKKREKLVDKYTENYTNFIQRLKEAREDAGVSLSDASDMFGKSHNYVGRLESGQIKVDVKALILLAKIYNKPLEFFIDFVG